MKKKRSNVSSSVTKKMELLYEHNRLKKIEKQGKHEEVELVARKLLLRWPDDAVAWGVLGRLYSNQRRYNEALVCLRKGDPNDSDVQFHLGVALQVAGCIGEAERIFRRVTELAPNSVPAYFALASTLHEQGQLDDARINYARVLELRPSMAEALCNLGSLLHQQGLYVEAENQFRLAIISKPDLAMAYSNLGDCLLRQGRLEEAELFCLEALKLSPNYVEALGNLGAVYTEQNRFDDAEMCLRNALRLNQNYSPVLHNLAGVLKNKKKFEEAKILIEKSISLAPTNADSYITLGSISSDLGEVKLAIQAYMRAIQLSPTSAVAHQALGDILRYTPLVQDEIEAYRKAVELDPGGVGLEALVGLAVRHYLQGDTSELVAALVASRDIGVSKLPRLKPLKVYWNFIALLLGWYQKTDGCLPVKKELPILHVIGESHCLGAHRVVTTFNGRQWQCSSSWVPGCKMWHLGSDAMSRFRYSVEKIFSQLPVGATVLMTIGEIDCRPNEGFWKELNTHQVEVNSLVNDTVLRYVNTIGKLAKDAKVSAVALQGVPAPRYNLSDELDPGDSIAFLMMLRKLNMLLRRVALEMGWSFVDAYKATADGNGVSNNMWHIDDVHLAPSFYEQLDRWTAP